ncbi:MAG: hypothetical protein IPL21_15260 [Saprospirales bacterium]|nr:hypothetical protein [Saprospirales bacterium]
MAESNNKLLQSGGMFKVNAYLENVPLKMKKDMNYIVQINNQNLQNDMTVFAPNTQQQDGLVRWETHQLRLRKLHRLKVFVLFWS